MKRWLYFLLVIAAMAVLLSAMGCKSKQRSDDQISMDVQKKVSADPSLQNKTISVQAANGVVTLSGVVDNDASRNAAANDAATVDGVRTVVNNVQVQPGTVPASQQAAEAQPAPTQEPVPAPAAASTKPAASRNPRHGVNSANNQGQTQYARNNVPYDTVPASSNYNEAPRAAQPTPAPAPAPQVPQKITIPEGTTLAIRMIDAVDTDRNHDGDTFRATLNSPVIINGHVAIPADADVQGRVVEAKNAAHFNGQSALTLELTRVSYNGHTYTVQTNAWSRQGKSRGKESAVKIGGGAALGTIIGAIAGGGKGAAIGGVVGAGAGTAAQGATRGEQVRLAPETLLTFQLHAPVTVQPAPAADRNAGRQKLNE